MAQERERFSFMISYFADGKRRQQMFADFEQAHAEAKSTADKLAAGQLDAVAMSNKETSIYAHAAEAVKPTGVPLDLAAKEYAEAWKVLGGKASIIEAAKEFARRHLHTLPDKMLPDAVEEMLEAKKREHTGEAYMKVLRIYLNQLSASFHCQLRSVTTGQLADFLRNMDVSARSKNNARATIGAFFKFCKERGWLPRDHEGIELVPKFKEKGGRVVPFGNVNKQIGWLVEDTNVGLKKAAKEAGKDPEKAKAVWKKNALRHSFISYRVADIQNVNQVALEAGNSSAIIFKHYRELVRGAEAKTWFGIEPKAAANVTAMPKKDGQAA